MILFFLFCVVYLIIIYNYNIQMLRFVNTFRSLRMPTSHLLKSKPVHFFGGGHHEPVDREKLVFRDEKSGIINTILHRLLFEPK